MIFFKIKFLNLIDLVRNFFLYYRNYRFARIDMLLLASYFWISPYRIARLEAKRRKMASLEPYGETPLSTMEQIALRAGISKKDIVYELGCGRGRCAFWLSLFCQCKVVGIEAIDLFIKKAQKIVHRFHLQNVLFVRGDFRTMLFPEASVLYLFGSQLTDEEIKKFIKNIKRQQITPKIITISFWLGEYDSGFDLVDEFEAAFPWGKTTCYIQKQHDEKINGT